MKDHLGGFYDKTSDFQHEQFLSLCALVAESVAPQEDIRTLLDIGAGTGARTRTCLGLFPALEHITAIEPDRDMIETARAKYADARITYLQMEAADIPRLAAEKKMFDAVLSNWALHWVPDKEKLMTDLAAVTRPGAWFMFSTCEDLPAILRMVDAAIRAEFKIAKQRDPYYYLTAGAWRELLARHGWEVAGHKAYTVRHEVESAARYLDHWFAASATKFMYGKHLVELSALSRSDLVWMMNRAFPSATHEEGLCFTEDVMFTVARRK